MNDAIVTGQFAGPAHASDRVGTATAEAAIAPGAPGAPAAPPDDETLVARAQSGSLLALEELFRRHQTRMYRVAVHILGDHHRAEDAVQDSLVSAWRRIGTFRADAAFSSWLYRIVTNRCLNMARAQRPTVPLENISPRPSTAAGAAPEAAAVINDQLDAFREALRTLPPEQRVCWVLREHEGLPYEEIAMIVDATTDSVRGRIHRARGNLAERMGPWR